MNLLKYRRKFIKAVISNKLIISKKLKQDLIDELTKLEYPELSTNINTKPSYDYLVGMPMWSLTQEKIDELEANFNEKETELNKYKNTTTKTLWLGELEELENAYAKWYDIKLSLPTENIDKKKNKKSLDKKVNTTDKKNKSTVSKSK